MTTSDMPQRTPGITTNLTERMADQFDAREHRWVHIEHPENRRCVALQLSLSSFDRFAFYTKKDDDERTEQDITRSILGRAETFLDWLTTGNPVSSAPATVDA